MREQKEVFIGNDKYLIQQFGAVKGFRIGKKVGRVMLPVISKAFGEEEASMADLMDIVAENIDYIDEETIIELVSETTKNKQMIDFDNEFAGNYMTLFKLIWEIIQFNFSDLLFSQPLEEETQE